MLFRLSITAVSTLRETISFPVPTIRLEENVIPTGFQFLFSAACLLSLVLSLPLRFQGHHERLRHPGLLKNKYARLEYRIGVWNSVRLRLPHPCIPRRKEGGNVARWGVYRVVVLVSCTEVDSGSSCTIFDPFVSSLLRIEEGGT